MVACAVVARYYRVSGACMYDVRILRARMNTQQEREIPEPRARIASNISNDGFMTGSYRLR
jgi:hypothetical protein